MLEGLRLILGMPEHLSDPKRRKPPSREGGFPYSFRTDRKSAIKDGSNH
jgi:hypothetical protein